LVTSQPVAPTQPAPTPEEIQAAKDAAKIKKVEADARALQHDKEMADQGDSYGERRMGERYRDGDGVKRNLNTAGIWLGVAANHGDKEAAKELNELPSK
jgi:TPR repeat protein